MFATYLRLQGVVNGPKSRGALLFLFCLRAEEPIYEFLLTLLLIDLEQSERASAAFD